MYRVNYTPLSQEEKQIVLGTLLGDGQLVYHENGKPELRIWHSSKDAAFVQWKYDNLPNLRGNNLTLNYKRKCGYSAAFFRSIRHPYLSQVYSLLYKNGKKVVTRKYLNLLNPLGIAVWWMDDGTQWKTCRGGHQGTLCTCSFSLEENELIAKWFETIWGIYAPASMISSKYKGEIRRYPAIRLNGTNLKRMSKLIRAYVPECMSRKIWSPQDDPALCNVEFLPVKTNIRTVESDIV